MGEIRTEDTAQVHAAAARGVATAATALPFGAQLQAAFGPDHDVSRTQAHIGGDTAAAMGATAYTSGNHVVFDHPPDLRTAAHEAAHVIQQARGVQLFEGVGRVGDAYEQHADAVADRVVAGRSAADLFGTPVGPTAATGQVDSRTSPALQKKSKTSPHIASAGALIVGAPRVPRGRLRIAPVWDMGETVCEEPRTWLEVIENPDAFEARISTAILAGPDSDAFTLSSFPMQIEPLTCGAFEVAYDAKYWGTRRAEVVMTVEFGDGTFQDVIQPLTSRARWDIEPPRAVSAKDQAAYDKKSAAEHAKEHAAEEELITKDKGNAAPCYQDNLNDLDFEFKLASSAAQTLAAKQQQAVTSVSELERDYKKKPPVVHRSIWWTVLELSLTTATAGIAGVVAEKLTPVLFRMGGEVEEAESLLLKGMSDAVEDGLKDGVKKAIGEVGPKEDTESRGREGAGENGKPKAGEGTQEVSNVRVDFFSNQLAILIQVAEENRNTIIKSERSLRPLLRTKPDVAIRAARALTAAVNAAKKLAVKLQLEQVSSAWISLVARSQLGTDKIGVNTTDMRSLKPEDELKDGVLDIAVACDPLRPVNANLTGVSKGTANIIANMRLAHAQVPVQLRNIVKSIKSGQGVTATKDEAGRVFGQGQTRLQAQEDIDEILAKSLVEWGEPIRTDDVGGKR